MTVSADVNWVRVPTVRPPFPSLLHGKALGDAAEVRVLVPYRRLVYLSRCEPGRLQELDQVGKGGRVAAVVENLHESVKERQKVKLRLRRAKRQARRRIKWVSLSYIAYCIYINIRKLASLTGYASPRQR